MSDDVKQGGGAGSGDAEDRMTDDSEWLVGGKPAAEYKPDDEADKPKPDEDA